MTASLSRRRFFQLAGLTALAFPLRGLAALDTSGGDEIGRASCRERVFRAV